MNPAAMRYQGDTVFLGFQRQFQYATTNKCLAIICINLQFVFIGNSWKRRFTGPDSSLVEPYFHANSCHRRLRPSATGLGLTRMKPALLAGDVCYAGLREGQAVRVASERHGPVAQRQHETPGFMALNYGYQTPISVLVAHAAFGAILGA